MKKQRKRRDAHAGTRKGLAVTCRTLTCCRCWGGVGGSPQPRISIPADRTASALSSLPEKRAVSSSSRRQPRGGFARVGGLDPGKPQTSRTSPSAAALLVRDARLRLRARRDGTPSLLATCCHSNPSGGSQRRLLPPTERFLGFVGDFFFFFLAPETQTAADRNFPLTKY